MKFVPAAHGVSPASQPVEGFWFPFPQFLVLLRVSFGRAGLEGRNERILNLTVALYKRLLGTFSSCFHTLSHCLGEQDNVQCVQLSPRTAQLFHPALPSLPFPANTENPQWGGRWQMAQSTEALGGKCQRFLNSPNRAWPDRFCTALSPSMHSHKNGVKECLAGCQPPGKDALGPAGSSGEWLLIHLCRESRRALQRRQRVTWYRTTRRTLPSRPVRTWRLNATNLLWFLNEIKVMRW